MPDIFLSYSREDQPTARKFAEGLKLEGFDVWWDQALTIGEAFDKITEKALDDANVVVVLWSRHSVDSRWVRAEATQAQSNNRLAPVMIEACKRPIMFELTHTADLSNWKGDTNEPHWRSFVAELKRFLERNAPIGSRAPVTAAPSSSQTVSEPARSGGIRSRAALAVGAVALLVILGGIWWKLGSPTAKAPSAAASAAAPSTAATQSAPVTLAVLPFANLSSDPEQEYFSDGLTEEILNQLAQVRGLRVTGRTSSYSFKGKNEDLREIARKLGVDNILEGSIRKDGERLRITAQLIDGRNGAHLWSRAYDQTMSGVFDLQDEVARDVARALSITLDVGEIRRAEGGTTNVEAWERYLRRREERSGDRASLERRASLLREALRLDPQFALAWRELGFVMNEIPNNAEPPLPAEQAEPFRREGRAARERALALAPDAWWARSSRIADLRPQGKWAEAESMARSILEESPMTGADWQRGSQYAGILMDTGRNGEALRLYEELVQIEPLVDDFSARVQALRMSSGDCKGGEREYQRRISLGFNRDIDHYLRLLCLIAEEGPDQEAVQAMYRRTQETAIGLSRELFAELSRVHGDPAAVRRTLEAALAAPGPVNRAISIAQLANAYRDREMTFAALETLPVPNGLVWRLPPWSGVRSDPRFKKMVREWGLYDYWRSTGIWADFCKPVGTDDFECK